jgi:hypothetical protein
MTQMLAGNQVYIDDADACGQPGATRKEGTEKEEVTEDEEAKKKKKEKKAPKRKKLLMRRLRQLNAGAVEVY